MQCQNIAQRICHLLKPYASFFFWTKDLSFTFILKIFLQLGCCLNSDTLLFLNTPLVECFFGYILCILLKILHHKLLMITRYMYVHYIHQLKRQNTRYICNTPYSWSFQLTQICKLSKQSWEKLEPPKTISRKVKTTQKFVTNYFLKKSFFYAMQYIFKGGLDL